LQVIVPIFQHEVEQWIVFFVDTCNHSSNQVSILISSKTKLEADQIKKFGETFAEQAHDAFVDDGYAFQFAVHCGRTRATKTGLLSSPQEK